MLLPPRLCRTWHKRLTTDVRVCRLGTSALVPLVTSRRTNWYLLHRPMPPLAGSRYAPALYVQYTRQKPVVQVQNVGLFGRSVCFSSRCRNDVNTKRPVYHKTRPIASSKCSHRAGSRASTRHQPDPGTSNRCRLDGQKLPEPEHSLCTWLFSKTSRKFLAV